MFHADGQTDRHNEANSTFHNFVKVPKKQNTDCCYIMLQYKSGATICKEDLQANKTLPNLTLTQCDNAQYASSEITTRLIPLHLSATAHTHTATAALSTDQHKLLLMYMPELVLVQLLRLGNELSLVYLQKLQYKAYCTNKKWMTLNYASEVTSKVAITA